MSASTEKKNRRAAREAGTDKRTLAAREEAKKKAVQKRRWTIGTIVVVLLIAVVIVLNTSLPYTTLSAVSIAGRNYTPAEVSYYYGNSYFTWANQYGSYASVFGLDTSGGIYGLSSQECPMLEEGSWRDFFLDTAKQQMIQSQALSDYAAENGIALDDEELAEIDANLDATETYAQTLGYSGIDKFLSANYGRGLSLKDVRGYSAQAALADKVMDQKEASLSYEPYQLEEYYRSLDGASDRFDFAYYYAAAETVESTDENGETSSAATEETIAAAKALAEDILADYEAAVAEAGDSADYGALLDEAVAAHVDGATATHQSDYPGSSLNAYADFLKDSQRETGDAAVVDNTNADGSYVVVFLSRNDNHYPMAQVRHILIQAEAGEDGTYSEEAKEAAKARAEEILAEWKAGDATEESFAALAEEYSEDDGSNTNGGLYDHVYKGQMVEEFDEFCFAGHKPGDTAIVYGESSSYAGYHVMYYVGEGEQYSDYIARTALTEQDLSAWLEELTASYTATDRFGLRLVG